MKGKSILNRVIFWLGAIAVIFFLPILWSAIGNNGYFENKFCLCDAPSYYFFHGNQLWDLRPGNGDWGRPVFNLKANTNGWDAISADAPAGNYYKPLRLQMRNGNLYELWDTTWISFPRVYNVWKVWYWQFFPPPSERKAQHINCFNNLKQIGLAFQIWEGDNHDQYPFNVSTNDGGTRELRQKGPDGFDPNSFQHFLVMSNELATPRLLICPKDKTKSAAANWASLGPQNVSYRLCCGDEITETNSNAILAVCPVDGNRLYCDGHVTDKNGNPPRADP
ncbi:MAG TPA: hypothetical protein VF988_01295 [Verrucomicrobiae bacterium]